MLCSVICYFLYIFAAALILNYFFLRSDPPPIFGVYAQPGKFFLLKYWLFRLVYFLRRRKQQQQQKDAHANSRSAPAPAGYGVKSKSDVTQMEQAQKLPPDQPLAVDAVYFNGCDQNGTYFMASIARRPKNISQTVLMLRSPQFGLLELPSLPDTNLTTDGADGFQAGGLRIEPVEPMKRWRIRYEGKLRSNRQTDSDQLIQAKLDLEWTACTDYFDFDTDMDAHALATAIAREPWSRAFFQRLQSSHQTHYEQFGDLVGKIELMEKDGVRQIHTLKLRGARDHSYGNVRVWSYFHRYAMQFVHLSDGTCFNAALVSMPNVTMSRLEFGYLLKPDGRKLALRRVNLPIHQLGEQEWAEPPKIYEFSFEDEENQKYRVQCEVLDRPEFFMGNADKENNKREAVILEQMCRYTVNGEPGWGFSEWEYRVLDG